MWYCSVDKVQWRGVTMGNLLCARQEAAQRRQAPAAAFIGNHTSTCRTGAAGPFSRSGLQEIRLQSTARSHKNKIQLDWCVWSSASTLICDAHPAHDNMKMCFADVRFCRVSAEPVCCRRWQPVCDVIWRRKKCGVNERGRTVSTHHWQACVFTCAHKTLDAEK